jgi:hypothetical protein
MGLKNWTVTSEAIRKKTTGLIKYINYLNNKKHERHENTSIINIFSDPERPNKFIKKCVDEALTLDLKNAEKGKGGRPVDSYAVSFDLTLPPGTIRPTAKQWRSIANDIYKTIGRNLDNKLTSDHIYMNVHDQDNPHLNVVVSKIINGNRERKIDQKALLSKIKLQYNKSVLEHCGLDYRDYEPEGTGYNKRLKRWQHDIKLLEKAQKQFKSLVDYYNENNQKRINSTKNRMIKNLSKITDENQKVFFDQADEIEDPQLKELMDEVRQGVEEQASKPQPNRSKMRPR